MGAGCWKMYIAAARAIVTPRFESAKSTNQIRALDPYHILQMGGVPIEWVPKGVLLPLSLSEHLSPEHS